jgi:adenosylhomocysteine nucleosidase
MNHGGITNIGDGNTVANNAIGENASVHIGHQKSTEKQSSAAWHFGVVTILAKETRAVLDVLGLTDDGAAGQRFYTGRLDVPGGATNLVVTQPSGQGQRPIMAALTNLRDRYDPAVIALVGIGGGIHGDVAMNDVVVATRVVFYENRKLLPRRTVRRGQELQAPSVITHSVNAFFTASGDPATLPGQYHVHNGLIGTGEAVIANAADENRHYLTSYHDKVMAVEMEAGGLAQFCHDTTTRSGAPVGWVVIRGISDRADAAKDDQHHDSAAVNAAQTLRYLIPYIRPRL